MFTHREKCPWGYAVALAKFLGATRIIQDRQNVYTHREKCPWGYAVALAKFLGARSRIDRMYLWAKFHMPSGYAVALTKFLGAMREWSRIGKMI